MKSQLSLLLLLCLALKLQAQQNISGTIRDQTNGQPLLSASINLKLAKQTQLSDANGQFSFANAKLPDTLIVSYLGYVRQMIPLSANLSNPIIINLVPINKTLEEVTVNTGYQELPKERANGSFVQITEKQLQEQVGPTILERLEALASGFSVDRATTTSRITIRGLSTLGTSRDPLIILDNFPYEGDLNNLNPNDVESITILKDAASASIWGARAGNGVIVINTKKGKFNQTIKVDFNSNVTIGSKPDLNAVKQMSSADYIELEQFLYDRNFYASQINSTNRTPLSPVVELLMKRTSGTVSGAEATAQINIWKQKDVRNDFDSYLYGNALNQQYALNLSGGTAQNSWLLFTGFDDNQSNLDAGYQRVNLKFQNNLRVGKKLNVSTGLRYTQSNSSSGKPGYNDIRFKGVNLYPYASLADENGNALPIVAAYSQNYISTAGNGKLLDWAFYPLTDYQNENIKNGLTDLVANTGVNYQINQALSSSINYQYQTQQSVGTSYYNQESYLARNLINQFTQIPTNGNPIYKIPVGGILDLANTNLVSHQVRGQLNLNKKWQTHELTGILGSEVREAKLNSDRDRKYGYNQENGAYGNVDYTTTFPRFFNNSAAFIPDNQSFGGTTTRFISFYGNAAYTFKEKYTLSASARSDASNLYGVNTQDKWQPLWSTGLGWELSKEKFYQSKALPYLKLRTTYGYSGNTDPSLGAVTTIALFSNSPYTNSPYYRFDQYANPELRWETSAQLNLGVDFRTKDNRLVGAVEYYRKRGFDLISIEPVDYTNGVGFVARKNAAEIEGNGWDISLNSLNTKGLINWSSNLNFSIYRDQIKKYYLTSTQGSSFLVSGNPRVSGLVGSAIYSIFSYPWAGLNGQNGQPQGIDEDGNISMDYRRLTGTEVDVEDLVYHGSAIPVYYGSFGNSINYKDFSVSAALVFKLGYYFRRETIDYADFTSSNIGHSDYAQRWKQPGDEANTNIAAFAYPLPVGLNNFYEFTSPFVERGDHIRLQYVNVAYQLPKSLLTALKFKSIQLYLNAANLGLLWTANQQGIDPDYRNSFTLPPIKTFSFGIRAGL